MWGTTLGAVLMYVATFAYMALVILVGEFVLHKFNTDKEMTRKCEHLATCASWAICYFFVGPSIHLVIVNFLSLLVFAVLTFGNLMKSAEREDADKSYGIFYFGLATFVTITITILFNKDFIPYSAIAYYCLALADGFAPIIAKLAGRYNVTMFKPKSLVGFLTVLVISSLVTLCCNFIFQLNLNWAFIIAVGCFAAHAELYGQRGFDNVTVNLGVFGLLVLNHYGLVTLPVLVALISAPAITIFITQTKALTMLGALFSFCYVLATAIFGNFSLVMMILILFVAEGIVSKFTSERFKSNDQEEGKPKKEKKGRSAFQIIANAAVACVCVIAYYFTNNVIFMYASIVAIAEEFADSMASDIGRLSRFAPLDILKFKPVTPGISGGVSILGLVSALVGAAVAVFVAYCFGVFEWHVFLILVLVAFLGTIIDSVLGSLMQVLYKCPTCQTLTEREECCGNKAEIVKGVKCIDNSMVNLLTGALTSIIAILIFIVL